MSCFIYNTEQLLPLHYKFDQFLNLFAEVPDPGFLPRDLHADSGDADIVDWNDLSDEEYTVGTSSLPHNPFIEYEAVECHEDVETEEEGDDEEELNESATILRAPKRRRTVIDSD